jgi:SAM-dependent methyltransferase
MMNWRSGGDALLARIKARLRLSRARRNSNAWLRETARNIPGRVLSIGSASDDDGQGGRYRDYFRTADSYTTSEVEAVHGCDLVLDVRSMPEIESGSFDCIFCSGVLEHVDDYAAGLREITRVLAPGGLLLLGLPFRQGLHMAPHDYWRFTEYGIRHLLRDRYDIEEMVGIDPSPKGFPASYWTRARKKGLPGGRAMAGSGERPDR